MSEPIAFSRYRVAKAITDRYAAGESVLDIGVDYFPIETNTFTAYIVELIVAAADREGKYESTIYGEAPEGYDATREDV